MLNKFLYVVVVLASVAAAIAGVALAGCEDKDPMLTQPPKSPPPATTQGVACLDGWEVIALPGGSVQYRHQHDVAEHLISCQGD